MGRFIRLTNPEDCLRCKKMIRAGRVAYWYGLSTFECYSCHKKGGEAAEIAEEKAMIEELERQ
jgi:hypothetical protein